MTSECGKSFQNSISVSLVKKLSLYDLPVKSWFLPILGNGRGQKRGFPKELGIQLFFMMLGDHIQCISEEISFIGFCLTFSAIIGWIIIIILDANVSKFIKVHFWTIRVYASQNGQKKGRSLKITKHILSRFLFHKKLIWHSYFSSRGLIQTQNHFFFEKNWPENRPPKKYASQNGQIWISIIFWWRYFFNFYHHTSLENLLKNGVIS